MTEVTDLLKIWAKSEPFHPLLYHMIDAGNVAIALLSTKTFAPVLRKFADATGCPEENCKAWLAYLVALHDIGKCDPYFQLFNEDLARGLKQSGMSFPPELDRKFLHEKRSHEWIKDVLEKSEWGRRAYNTVSNSILAHHSRFSDYEPYDYPVMKAQWDDCKKRLDNDVKNVFKPPQMTPVDFNDNSKVGILLSGLIVLSDWIASNQELMEYNDLKCSYEDYAYMSMAHAKKAIERLGFNEYLVWNDKVEFCDVWSGSSFNVLRPIQQKCVDIFKSEKLPRLIIIEAPMGEGKTEAAIYSAVQIMEASGLSGLYVALPTAATSNQMYGRINAFLDMHKGNAAVKARLVHGMSWLIDDASTIIDQHTDDESDNTSEIVDWFKPSKRALLAPYSVGTIDQSLMSVLNVKFGFLRLFGLSNKVLIIDEVHAYDAYMSTILSLLLKWCACIDIPVIMLSATLPSNKKTELLASFTNAGKSNMPTSAGAMDYPLITYIDTDGKIVEEPVAGSSKQMVIRLEKYPGYLGDYHRIASLAMEVSANGGCICIILNTVKTAQQVYLALKEIKGADVDVVLFHSRFMASRRDEIEKKALELFDKRSLLSESDANHKARPERVILVATQVVEQSLDIDFDEMITELAPIDLILQRVGRLHRHNRKERPTGQIPKIHVLLPDKGKLDFGSSEKVYARYILIKTLDIVLQKQTIALPSDIRGLVEETYAAYAPGLKPSSCDITTDDLSDSYHEMLQILDSDRGKAAAYLIGNPSKKEYLLAPRSFSFDEDDEGARSY
ncbi:MAG TPA: CRISPR-associated helicase Cas3', partial [Methanocella sp.]